MEKKSRVDLVAVVDILKKIRQLSELTECYNNSIEFYNAFGSYTI